MTPLEKAIELANSIDGHGSEDIKQCLQAATPRQIQTFIHSAPIHRHDHLVHWARTALDIRLAEDAAKRAGRLEQQMDKLLGIVEAQKRLAENLDRQTATLIALTRAVKMFTVFLIVLTIGLLVEGGVQFFEFHKTAPQFPVGRKQANQTYGVTQHNQATNK